MSVTQSTASIASPSSSCTDSRSREGSVLSIAILGYDGTLHWNAHLVPRRASLPIDPCIAELFEAWGVVSDANELLRDYEHAVLRPSPALSSSTGGGGGSSSNGEQRRVIPEIQEQDEVTGRTTVVVLKAALAYCSDVNGLVLVVFTKRCCPSSSEAAGDGIGFTDESLSKMPSWRMCQAVNHMACWVRCVCQPQGCPQDVIQGVLNASQRPATEWHAQSDTRMVQEAAWWREPVTAKALRKNILRIGPELVRTAVSMSNR